MLTRQMAISRRGSFIHVFQSPPQEGGRRPGWVLKGSFFPMNSKNHPQILRKTLFFQTVGIRSDQSLSKGLPTKVHLPVPLRRFF